MKNPLLFLFLCTIVVIFSSCTNQRSTACWDSSDAYYEDSDMLLKSDLGTDKNKELYGLYSRADGEGKVKSNDVFKNRKIISSADLRLTVAEIDSSTNEVIALAKKYGGYIQSTGYDRVTMRVPSEDLAMVIADVEAMGTLTDKLLSGQDVTNQYMDLEIRLANAETARNRYLELLAQAEDVKAALLVEKELERLNDKIESLKGQIQRMGHLAVFATVEVRLTEKKKPGVIGYVGLGFYKATKWLFVRN